MSRRKPDASGCGARKRPRVAPLHGQRRTRPGCGRAHCTCAPASACCASEPAGSPQRLERFFVRERDRGMTEHFRTVEGERVKAREQITPDNVSSKAWHQGLITARALQSKQFKPVRIILPRLIPEGVTLLAGKPKVGKSWLALEVCLAVADKSRFVLDDTRPVHGNALYLALEDNERRLHWRIKKIVQGQPQWPDWLDLRTEWRRVDEGGLEDIEAWCESVKQPRLIWIDTLPKIRPLGLKGREQAYAADYRAIE